MSFLDVFLGLLLLYGIVRGFWNGFFTEIASLVSLMIGIYVAIKFSYLIKATLVAYVSWNPKGIQIAAFAITFIAVVIAISFLAKFFTSIASFAGLGILNKFLGAILGLIKMTLIVSISLNLFVKMNKSYLFVDKATLDKSLFYHPTLKTAELVYPSLENWFSEWKKEEKPNKTKF